MDITTIFIVMRMLERIIAVLIGAFLVYLGYTLFLKLPELRNAEGKINLSDNISIYLSHIGPGAFFALFGSTVVALSIVFGMRLDQRPLAQAEPVPISVDNNSQPTTSDQTTISIRGIGQNSAAEKVDEKKLRDTGRYIALLNGLDKQLNPELPLPDRVDISASIPQIKLALMETIWNSEQWGDWQTFRAWVEDGSIQTPDTQLIKSAAVQFFNNGLPGEGQ
jgi:hypothetical protein